MAGYRSRSPWALAALVTLMTTACSTSGGEVAEPSPAPAAPIAPAPTTPATTAAPVPFTATVEAVTASDLGSSWRPGCPAGPDELRRLRLTYWGFDDRSHEGALVVAAPVAQDVVTVFRTLYEQRFPIRRMETVDAFGGDDGASMAADNTSAFNCRLAVTTGPARWSDHAYGRAVDVNPVENPYLLAGEVLPPEGAGFLDRSHVRPGMAVRGGPLVEAFLAAGWSWGGDWSASPDYQHFYVGRG